MRLRGANLQLIQLPLRLSFSWLWKPSRASGEEAPRVKQVPGEGLRGAEKGEYVVVVHRLEGGMSISLYPP